MITLARRRAIDRIRRNQALQRTANRVELEYSTAPEARPRNQAEEELNTAETREVIAEILKRLPDNQRQALILTKVHGRSHAEAAMITGTTPGAIKLRAHRAYVTLRQIMATAREKKLA